MQVDNRRTENPFFSVCIPQHNRTSFLLEACKVLKEQTFKDFEVCISDDISTDGREDELIEYLKSSGLPFIYRKNAKNMRYDANLRSSISLAKGKYCFLHGNDDCLRSHTTLDELFKEINIYKQPAAIVTNYEDWRTGDKNLRIHVNGLLGSGPAVAAARFRNLSFVSGILADRKMLQDLATDKWDGSEMYQMFTVSRIVAGGGELLELDISTIRKDIQIPGEKVDAYSTRPKSKRSDVKEIRLPLSVMGRLVADAVLPCARPEDRRVILEKIISQIYLYPYFFWIVEYKRVQRFSYALGVCIGMRPKNVFFGLDTGAFRYIRLCVLYLAVSITGLIMPIYLFDLLRPKLYYLAKSGHRTRGCYG